MRARYYDPSTGQFTSVDPLVAVISFHPQLRVLRPEFGQVGPLVRGQPLAFAPLDPLETDPVPDVPGFTPIARPTSAIGRSSSITILTASRRNSGGNFEGRPLVVVFLLLDMDFLLYEVSVQRGDAHSHGDSQRRRRGWGAIHRRGCRHVCRSRIRFLIWGLFMVVFGTVLRVFTPPEAHGATPRSSIEAFLGARGRALRLLTPLVIGVGIAATTIGAITILVNI